MQTVVYKEKHTHKNSQKCIVLSSAFYPQTHILHKTYILVYIALSCY